MSLSLALVPLAGFSGLMLTAACEDLRRFVIPNQLTIGLLLLWPLHALGSLGLSAALGALGCAVAVFVVGAIPFSRGLIGGGDVKLLAVATLWAGPGLTPELLLGSALAGGLLALLLLSPYGHYLTALRTPAAAAALPHANPMPYGVAIAAAALIVTIPPFFG